MFNFRAIAQAALGRVAGAVVGALTGFVAAKGLGDLNPDSAKNLTEILTNALMLAGYGIGHKVVDLRKR